MIAKSSKQSQQSIQNCPRTRRATRHIEVNGDNLIDSLHHGITEPAAQDGYTMDRFLICAAAEKFSAFATEEYLKARAARADLAAFDGVMAKVPDVPPGGNVCRNVRPGGACWWLRRAADQDEGPGSPLLLPLRGYSASRSQSG